MMPEFTEFMFYYGKKKLKEKLGSKSMYAWGKKKKKSKSYIL
jgi:hypothetical protein